MHHSAHNRTRKLKLYVISRTFYTSPKLRMVEITMVKHRPDILTTVNIRHAVVEAIVCHEVVVRCRVIASLLVPLGGCTEEHIVLSAIT